MAANNAPLSVRGLTKKYPAFELRDVSFDLERGPLLEGKVSWDEWCPPGACE